MIQIDLSGKTALVTGAAAGLGRAMAETLALAGAHLLIVDINRSGADETASRIASAGGSARALACDLSAAEAVEALHRDVMAREGGIDILINNAGIIQYGKGIASLAVEDWDRLMAVNVRSGYLLCHAFMETLKSRGWGRILFTSSLAARVGGIDVGSHYSASKAALIGMGRTLAKEGAPYGVTVNHLAPGIIATEPVKRQMIGREAQVAATIPLGRLGEPQDVANVALFLCSHLADYITGIVVDVNGGMYMG